MLKKLKSLMRGHLILLNKVTKSIEFSKKASIELLQKKHLTQKGNKSIVPLGYKIYSKNDEDGLIKEIFNRIGTTNKTFIEIGVQDGLESNTLALLFEDWKGLWIEGSSEDVKKIKKGFKKSIENGQLQITQSFITRENINQTILKHIKDKNIDLFSIDIDGNDYHVFDAISCVKPRVLVIEYNGKFRPPITYCMSYDERHIWDGSDNFGASLKFLELKLREKGYCLVGCNLTGGNAFFVKQELSKNHFLEPFTAENHYEPTRYELATHISGHRASYKTLENRLPTDSQGL